MALAHDTATRFPDSATATTIDTTTGDRTFSHAASASAKAAVVIILSDIGSATVTGVLYGGAAMTEATSATDTSEPGHVQIWFLGDLTGLGGTQTVTLQGASATGKVAYCATVTGDQQTARVQATGATNTTTSTNPTTTITGAQVGAMVYGGVMGGAGAPTSYAPGTGETALTGGNSGIGADHGANAGHVAMSNGPVAATGDYTFNFTYATSDDWCVCAVSVAEIGPVLPLVLMPTPIPSPGPGA